MSTMQAVRIHGYGDVDQLQYEEAPRPAPGPGEVLIQVKASSVNPFDCFVRAGYLAEALPHQFPLILGADVSGVVADVGEGVEDFSAGDEVYARVGVFRDGSYAQYAVAFAQDTAAKPKTLDHIHAGAMPHVSVTAWHALFDLGQLSEGQTVLIHGAAGGLGHIAVQLAHLRGAKVIGTASQNLDFVRDLGVDQAVDYTAVPFEEVVSDVDVVLDTIGGEVQARSCMVLKPDGMLISLIHEPPEELVNSYGVRAAMVTSTPNIGKVLSEISQLVDAGSLQPTISEVLPLQKIREAHEIVQARHMRGKLALEV